MWAFDLQIVGVIYSTVYTAVIHVAAFCVIPV